MVGANRKVTMAADQLTSYYFLCTATSTSSITFETLHFSIDEWNNLYGSFYILFLQDRYRIISSDTSKITSYLIEIVVCTAGIGVATAIGTYLINGPYRLV